MLAQLSLGSNLGNREQTLLRAVELIEARVGNVIRRSSFFYSAPWGFTSEHEFCNICIAVDTLLSPIDLLHATQSIEREMGKTTHSEKCYADGVELSATYHDRTIDIDILTYEAPCPDASSYANHPYKSIILQTPELTLPHPHMSERDFVLIPLREIL